MGLRDDIDRMLRGETDVQSMRTSTGKKLLRKILDLRSRVLASEARIPKLERRIRDLEAVLDRYTRDLT